MWRARGLNHRHNVQPFGCPYIGMRGSNPGGHRILWHLTGDGVIKDGLDLVIDAASRGRFGGSGGPDGQGSAAMAFLFAHETTGDDKWLDAKGFKIEADSVGNKVVMSASLEAKQEADEIEEVAGGKRTISKLFSKKQGEFLAEFYDGPIDLDDLAVLGPVPAFRADIDRPGMTYELTAEYWTLPDVSHLLEQSIKCPPEEAVVAREVFQAFLAGHGLDPHGAQATKTNLALKGLVEQIKQK